MTTNVITNIHERITKLREGVTKPHTNIFMSSENQFELYPAVGKFRQIVEKTQDDLDSMRRTNQASLKTMTIAAQVVEMTSSTLGTMCSDVPNFTRVNDGP